jgi:hypothetical protein
MSGDQAPQAAAFLPDIGGQLERLSVSLGLGQPAAQSLFRGLRIRAMQARHPYSGFRYQLRRQALGNCLWR